MAGIRHGGPAGAIGADPVPADKIAPEGHALNPDADARNAGDQVGLRIGRLLRYINLPPQWTTRAGSGFDTLLIEGYQYPGINHNLDQATRCAQYPWKELAWDQAHCRYLMGLYYGTWPWLREFVNVNRLGLPAIKLWAYDHLCLFGWPIPLPTTDDRSFIY